MTTLVYDIETDGLLDTVSNLWLIVIGDPATGEVIAYSDVDDQLQPISQAMERLTAADILVGHNVIGYDVPALGKLGHRLSWRKHVDTVLLSRMADPTRRSHSLADWGERLGFPKGDFKEFDRYSQEMLEYALQDVRVNLKIWEKLQPVYDSQTSAYWTEAAFYAGMSAQMQDGFPFDVQAALEIRSVLLDEAEQVTDRMQEVFPPRWVADGEHVPKRTVNYKDPMRASTEAGCAYTKVKLEVFNPGSRSQIASRFIAKYNWKPSVYTNGGSPEISEKILKDLPFAEASEFLSYLTAQKKLSQVDGFLKAEKQGRIHGYINTIGTVTHRCTHRSPNVAQVDKDHRIRSLFTPDPGWTMVGCDASGLELRMLAHYLSRWDGGAFGNSVINGSSKDGTDVHTRNQKIAGLKARDSAKTMIYALNDWGFTGRPVSKTV